MNWDYTGSKSYVDVIPPTTFFHPSSAYERPPFGIVPQSDGRLMPGVLRQPCSSDELRSGTQQAAAFPVHGPAQTYSNAVLPSQRLPLLRTSSLPPVDPSKQLSSTPELHQGAHSPASSQNTPAVSQSAFTPPGSATLPPRQSSGAIQHTNMADPRRPLGQQRPVMGPPETPSRVMQASPNMFPNLQFSPDLFSAQSVGPATAPIYPQQRLFWDSPVAPPENHAGQFHTPYQESFDNSFNSSSTIVPNYSPVVQQDNVFHIPQQTPPTSTFLDTTAFPMPFQTSPRPPPPSVENPTQFLSSPARRFGGSEIPTTVSFVRPPRDLPAYHHQIEESRRERELEKRRNKSAAKKANADLIMSSVKRALSPSKSLRPGLKRSQTHSGILAQQPYLRRASGASFNDSASASSAASVESGRNGRSSPLKVIRQISTSSVCKNRSSQKPRTVLKLAIDENGVAKTVLQEISESDDGMDIDEESQSVVSSDGDGDFDMLRSQTTSFAVEEDDSTLRLPRRRLESTHSNSTSRLVQNSRGVVAGPNGRGLRDISNSIPAGKGDAQKALRAIIEDRSRSVSAQTGYSSSRRSDTSVQFHSSPPIQADQFGDLHGSPTTITDPDLATPSTDQDSYGSLGATRCVCNSMSPDGTAMIQCDSCSKWLHTNCVGVDRRRLSDSDVFICVYCEQTPGRQSTTRGSVRSSKRGSGHSASPLAHKSVRPNRGR